jgi:hypothetical protein
MFRFTMHSVLVLSIVSVACGGDVRAPATAPTGELLTAADEPSGSTLDLGGAAVDQPQTWSFSEPSSTMRLAEATVSGPGGPALLTVFFFGPGGGGGVEANLERWAGQIETAAGGEPQRDSFSVDGFTISTIAAEGTLLPSGMGAGPTEPVPGSRLLGAVIEGPGGPWFFKLTGPAETVAAAAADFDRMLRSVRPAGESA